MLVMATSTSDSLARVSSLKQREMEKEKRAAEKLRLVSGLADKQQPLFYPPVKKDHNDEAATRIKILLGEPTSISSSQMTCASDQQHSQSYVRNDERKIRSRPPETLPMADMPESKRLVMKANGPSLQGSALADSSSSLSLTVFAATAEPTHQVRSSGQRHERYAALPQVVTTSTVTASSSRVSRRDPSIGMTITAVSSQNQPSTLVGCPGDGSLLDSSLADSTASAMLCGYSSEGTIAVPQSWHGDKDMGVGNGDSEDSPHNAMTAEIDMLLQTGSHKHAELSPLSDIQCTQPEVLLPCGEQITNASNIFQKPFPRVPNGALNGIKPHLPKLHIGDEPGDHDVSSILQEMRCLTPPLSGINTPRKEPSILRFPSLLESKELLETSANVQEQPTRDILEKDLDQAEQRTVAVLADLNVTDSEDDESQDSSMPPLASDTVTFKKNHGLQPAAHKLLEVAASTAAFGVGIGSNVAKTDNGSQYKEDWSVEKYEVIPKHGSSSTELLNSDVICIVNGKSLPIAKTHQPNLSEELPLSSGIGKVYQKSALPMFSQQDSALCGYSSFAAEGTTTRINGGSLKSSPSIVTEFILSKESSSPSLPQRGLIDDCGLLSEGSKPRLRTSTRDEHSRTGCKGVKRVKSNLVGAPSLSASSESSDSDDEDMTVDVECLSPSSENQGKDMLRNNAVHFRQKHPLASDQISHAELQDTDIKSFLVNCRPLSPIHTMADMKSSIQHSAKWNQHHVSSVNGDVKNCNVDASVKLEATGVSSAPHAQPFANDIMPALEVQTTCSAANIGTAGDSVLAITTERVCEPFPAAHVAMALDVHLPLSLISRIPKSVTVTKKLQRSASKRSCRDGSSSSSLFGNDDCSEESCPSQQGDLSATVAMVACTGISSNDEASDAVGDRHSFGKCSSKASPSVNSLTARSSAKLACDNKHACLKSHSHNGHMPKRKQLGNEQDVGQVKKSKNLKHQGYKSENQAMEGKTSGNDKAERLPLLKTAVFDVTVAVSSPAQSEPVRDEQPCAKRRLPDSLPFSTGVVAAGQTLSVGTDQLQAPPPRRPAPPVSNQTANLPGHKPALLPTNTHCASSAALSVDIDSLPEYSHPPDTYLPEAKRLKHAADSCDDQLHKYLTYLEAIYMFLLCGRSIERDSPTNITRISTLYHETYKLLLQIHQPVKARYANERGIRRNQFGTWLILSLYTQALICQKLYKLRKPETQKNRKIIEEHLKSVAPIIKGIAPNQISSTYQSGVGSGAAVIQSSTSLLGGIVRNQGSPASPAPSPSGSVASTSSLTSESGVQPAGKSAAVALTPPRLMTATAAMTAAAVSLPNNVRVAMQQYMQVGAGLLEVAHNCWEQGDLLMHSDKRQPFFTQVEAHVMPLTMHSSITQLVHYLKLAVELLKSTSASSVEAERLS